MANTTIPAALQPKIWAKYCWETAMNDIFFSKFTGSGADSIIQVLTDLSKGNSGDTLVVPLLMRLTGSGITGDNILEGNEEALVYRDFTVKIDQLRTAVRLNGRMEEKKAPLNLRKDAKAALSTWLTETIDKKIFAALTANPSSDRVIFGGTANSEASITSADKFSADVIGRAKRLAMTDHRAKIRPVKVDGGSYYVMVIDPWQARDLRSDQKWLDAQQYAAERGSKNPIFTGALGLYDGVVIHENDGVIRTDTGASSLTVGHALFLGAQAAAFAEGEAPRWVEKEFDYDNQIGFSIGRIMGIEKTKFKLDGENYTDFGCINVMTASEND